MDTSAAATAVIETLMRACSQDASVLKPAESLLKQWETQPGFYSILAVCGQWLTTLCSKINYTPFIFAITFLFVNQFS